MTEHNYFPAGLTISERDEVLSEAADRETELRADCDEAEREPRECPYCSGGSISVDGGSLRYRCPDCQGTGHLPPLEDEP